MTGGMAPTVPPPESPSSSLPQPVPCEFAPSPALLSPPTVDSQPALPTCAVPTFTLQTRVSRTSKMQLKEPRELAGLRDLSVWRLLNTLIPKTLHKGLVICLLLMEDHGVIYVIFLQ